MVRDSVPDVLQSTSSSPSSASVVWVGALQKNLDQYISLTFNRVVPNVIKDLHLQLRCHPPLLQKFLWFNIIAAMAHHPSIQKEVDEMLAKGSIEPWMGCAGLY